MKLWGIKQVAQQRFDTCKACENFVPETSKCTECKCNMKLKVKVAAVECPIGKWGKDGNA